MAVCACLEALALIGNEQSLEALRVKFPDAAQVPGLYLHSFLKLLGGTAGEESIEEICRMIGTKGAPVYEVAIDSLTRLTTRHKLSVIEPLSEDRLCNLLHMELDDGIRFHLVRLLGHFSRSTRITQALLPYIHDPDKIFGLAVVESLQNSHDPQVESALRSLLQEEIDPEISEELEELLRRRPRWNSPQSSTPS
jgi:hypothetical protein